MTLACTLSGAGQRLAGALRPGTAALAALLATLMVVTAALAGPVVSEVAAPATVAPVSIRPNAASANSREVVTVMVELADPPAAVVYADSLKRSVARAGASFAGMSTPLRDAARSAAVGEAKAQVAKLEATHQAILPALTSVAYGGHIVFRTKSAYNGISMLAARDQIAALSKLPGVKAVHVQTPKFPTAASDIDFLGTRSAWTDTPINAPTGIHGEGVKVAIIDSGLDYIHTNFGGPGTPAAYGSVTDTDPNGYFPSPKVPGGYDFAGDLYNASNNPFPVPDANPLDSSLGHGTASASLIGGLGVNADGSTYAGAYDNTTNIASLRISPGFAPKALLYPLRVFGVSGSTNLVTQAIDWAMDPNGDGNLADRMDVISMSLASDSGNPEDPDTIAAANAALVGIVVVSAAGNAGDSYYLVGNPSVATGTLSVAATYNNTGGFFYNGTVTVNAPAALAGQKYGALYGAPSPQITGTLTGNIVYAQPPDASTPLTNAALIAGNIALIDRDGLITFVAKVKAAQDAGAVAVIVVQKSTLSGAPYPIVMGLDDTAAIPALMIGVDDGAAIKALLDPVTRTGVNVTLANENGFVSVPATDADTVPSYSSRGPRLGDSMLKPDIAAPAEVVGVARSLSGDQVMGFNGTSSATPHVAGMMALLRQLHPLWTVEELMALAMNTATHDEFVGPMTGAGAQYGAGRVGAGRIDIAHATLASVVAYNSTPTDPRGLVSVSFGVVEVPVDGSSTISKSIDVTNHGTGNVTYDLAYTGVTPVAGATFTVGSGSPITVNAGQTVTIPVTFNAIGNQLKHVREAAVSATIPIAPPNDRQWLTEITGYAVLTPTGGTEPTLRVPLYAAPKPVSSMAAGTLVPGGSPGQFTLHLDGTPVNTGTNFPTDIVSLVKPFELQYVSALAGSPATPTNPDILKYVGVTSDYRERGANPQDTVLTFLLEGFGNASVPSNDSSDKEILIDLNGDGNFGYIVFLSTQSTGSATSNVYVPVILDIAQGITIKQFVTNGLSAATRDTNSYNNSVVTIPVRAASVGLAAASKPTKFYYRVLTFDHQSGNVVDDTGPTHWLVYDMAKPGLDAQGGNPDPFFYDDLPTTTIPVAFDIANYRANGSRGLILAHMHNATGARTDVVPFVIAPTLVSAVSRKAHAAAGTFDLPLSAVAAAPTTEPRQGPSQTVVFTFDRPVSGATVAVIEGTANAGAPAFSGNDVIVNLTGVTDRQYVTVSLTNVAAADGGTGGSGSVRIGYLGGDVNQSRVVTFSDLVLANAQLAKPVTALNFLKDVNASGSLTFSDLVLINSNLTRSLPAP